MGSGPPELSARESFPEDRIYDLVGSEGIARVVAGFYRRVPGDDILGPMYPAHDLVGAEERLRDFLIFRLGGPADYLEKRGHPRLRMRHAPYAINSAARDRWIALMDAAIDEAQLPDEAARMLRDFLGPMASFLQNRPS